MAGSLMQRFHRGVSSLQKVFHGFFYNNFPPDAALCLAGAQVSRFPRNQGKPFSIKDILDDGFLWAVPKHRRSLEKRQKRRFGFPELVLKILLPRKDLKTCKTCGDDHEAGVLCPTCYKKVIEETKAMQETIQAELKLDPVDKEVVVLYEGEKDEKPSEFWEGKRIVEMKKERPAWFSKNLLQQTTQKNATSTDVKPSELG